MRKRFLLGLLSMVGIFIIGCSNNGPIKLLDDQGAEIAFEDRANPALVFFFTGVG
jgi:hypothetical protein